MSLAENFQLSIIKIIIIIHHYSAGGGGGLEYKKGRDARRLA